MPITPNYGWTTPVVNGDFGAWGGILNAAFVEIDADIKALADTVAANALNVAKTNVANTFSGTQSFVNINATGTIAAATNVSAPAIFGIAPALPNDALNTVANFSGGTDTTLGTLGLGVRAFPSATAANRFMQIVAGDTLGLRAMQLRTNQLFLGADTAPAFVGAETVRINGSLSVAGITLTGGNPISGVGSGLFSIPQSGVVNLVTDLAGKSAVGHTHAQSDITGLVAALAAKSDVGHTHAQSDITGLVAALAGKSDTSHTHDASAIVSGSLPWTRIANPTLITFDAASTSPFTFVSNQTDTTTGTATTALNRPSGDAAQAVRGWKWIKVTYPGQIFAAIPVWCGNNV